MARIYCAIPGGLNLGVADESGEVVILIGGMNPNVSDVAWDKYKAMYTGSQLFTENLVFEAAPLPFVDNAEDDSQPEPVVEEVAPVVIADPEPVIEPVAEPVIEQPAPEVTEPAAPVAETVEQASEPTAETE